MTAKHHRSLLASVVSLYAEDDTGKPLLQAAMKVGDPKAFVQLPDLGAAPSWRRQQCNTLLHLAAAADDAHWLREAPGRGADTEVRNVLQAHNIPLEQKP